MLRHVFDRHGKEMALSDPQDAIDFVLDVLDNFDHVRQGDNGALVFSIENGRNRTGRRAVTILLSSKNGDYYGISTSGYERIDGLKKRKLLWEKGANNASPTDVASANVPTANAQLGNEQSGSASNMSNFSAGKDTESSASGQGNREKSANNRSSEVSTETDPRIDTNNHELLSTETNEALEQGALGLIPVDAEGNRLFESAPVKDTWDALVEMNEGDEAEAIDTARQMAENAREELAKEEKKQPKKGKTVAEIQANKKQRKEALAALRSKVDYWDGVAGYKEAERKRAAEQAKQEKRQRLAAAREEQRKKGYYSEENAALGDYIDFRDYVMRTIVTGGLCLKWGNDPNTPTIKGLAAHLGFGSNSKERNRMIWLLSNNGLSPEKAAESLSQGYAEAMGYMGYSEDLVSSQDALSELLDVVSSYSGRKAMFEAAKERRNAITSDEERYLEEQQYEYERGEAEAMHLSIDEWQDYKEAVAAEMKEAFDAATDEELAVVFAEAEEQHAEWEKEQELKNRVTDNGTENERRNDGGVGVLPAERSHIEGANERSAAAGQRRNDGSVGVGTGDVQEATESGEQGNETAKAPSNDGRGSVGQLAERQTGVPQDEEVDENGRPFVKAADGTTVFGEIREDSGLTPAPIKLSEGYQDEDGKGYGLAHIEANHGEQIRNAGFASVEDFVAYVAQNYDEDNIRVGKRRDNGSPTYLIQITDTHDNTLFIEMSKDGSYWNVNSAGIFRKGYSNKKETVAKTEPQQPNNAVSTGSSLSKDEEGGITSSEPNGEPTVSADKVTESSATEQENREKSANNRSSEVSTETGPRIDTNLAQIISDEADGRSTKISVDAQGNPIDKDGKLITEKVSSVDELTDEDFTSPKRSVQLPMLPTKVADAIGAGEKPVIIKKNIFAKNLQDHSDLTPEQSREILTSALYRPDLYGQNQKARKPYNWVVINTKDEAGDNRLVLIEVNPTKNNLEIVHWHYLRDRSLETIKRQAEREGGHVLILPSAKTEEAGGLSSRTQDLSSADKDTKVPESAQENYKEKTLWVKTRNDGTPLYAYIVAKNGIWLDVRVFYDYGKGETRKMTTDEFGLTFGGTQTDVDSAMLPATEIPKIENAIKRHGGRKRLRAELAAKDVTKTNKAKKPTETRETEAELAEREGKDNRDFKENEGKKSAKRTISDLRKDYEALVEQARKEEKEWVEEQGWENTDAQIAKTAKEAADYDEESGLYEEAMSRLESLTSKSVIGRLRSKYRKGEESRLPLSVILDEIDKRESKDNKGKAQFSKGGTRKPTPLQRKLGEALTHLVRKMGIKVVTDTKEMQEALEKSDAVMLHRAEVEDVSRRFDAQLDAYKKGEMRSSDWFSLGTPSATLLAAGIPAKEMTLNQSTLKRHLQKHSLTTADLRGLVKAIQSPMMVYEWGSKAKAHVVITDLTTKDGRKIAVAVRVDADGAVQEVNKIASVHGKTVERLLSDMNTDKTDFGKENLRYVDKKKALDWIAMEAPLASSQTNKGLNSAAKVINDFENPSVTPEILQKMTVWHGSPHSFDRFDHSHMGEGEGGQAHGWGTYVAVDQKTGRGYAERYGSSSREMTLFKGKSVQELIDDGKIPKYLGMYLRPQSSGISVERIKDEIQKDLEQQEEYLAKAKTKKLREHYGNYVDNLKECLSWLDGVQDEDFSIQRGHHLYEVEIPDDTGSNYLDEQKNYDPNKFYDRLRNAELSEAERKAVESTSQLFGMVTSGDGIYRALQTQLGGSAEAVSKLLNKAGFAGIHYNGRRDGECYVVFNDKDLKIVSHEQFLKTRNGEVYGFVKDGVMYIDPALLNPNTPIHEYGHLWSNALMKVQPELWAHGKEMMKKLPLWDEVKNDPNYADIKDNEDLVASEVFSRLLGAEGEKRLDDMVNEAKAKGEPIELAETMTLAHRIREWLKNALMKIRSAFGHRWTKEEAKTVTLDELKGMALKDFAEGFNPTEIAKESETQARFIGEKGAANIDKAEQATRMRDGLHVAREMEKAYKEKRERIERLKKSEPVEITGKEIAPSDDLKQYRKNANEYGLKNLRGEYTNKDTGNKITVVKNSVKEVTSHDTSPAQFQSVAAIPQILENGIYIDTLPNEDTAKHGDVVSYDYYVCGLKIGGVDYTVKAVVSNGVNGERYYDHRLTEIEKGKLISLTDAMQNHASESNSPLSAYKDKRLLSILQTNDKENARRMKIATGWERGADGKWRYEQPDFEFVPTGDARWKELRDEKKWAQELDKLSDKIINEEPMTDEEMKRWSELTKQETEYRIAYLDSNKYLDDYVSDADLFKAYPQLKQVRVEFYRNEEDGLGGSFVASAYNGTGVIKINMGNVFSDGVRSTLVHEVQHAIQHIEGFAGGNNLQNAQNMLNASVSPKLGLINAINTVMEGIYGKRLNWLTTATMKQDMDKFLEFHDGLSDPTLSSIRYFLLNMDDASRKKWIDNRGDTPEAFAQHIENRLRNIPSPIGKSAQDVYHRSAGEVEARNAEERRDMTDEERRQSLAEETEDVAREDQIFLQDALGVSNAKESKRSDDEKSQRDNEDGKGYSEEERGIIDRAKQDGTYMKAPNGKPTKLTEKQWTQVRTQAFKEWFGDWEKAARIEKLRGSEPVEITGEEYKGKYDLNRDSAQDWIKVNLRGEYTNEDTGEKISISRVGANKVTSHSMGNEAHLKSIAAIPQLIGKSIFIEEMPNTKDNGKYDSYRYYVCGLKIGGEDYTAKITIGVKQGNKYYDHSLTQIEKGTLIDSIDLLKRKFAEKNANGFTTTGGAPVPSYAVGKDTKLLSILQTNSSKVVDENGEPMVVYHGTRSDFTKFANDKIGTNLDYGTAGMGFYFTTSKTNAQNIARNSEVNGEERVMESFLNIRSPKSNVYIVELDGSQKQAEKFTNKAKAKGYDGIHASGLGLQWFVAFSPNQIKSATDNNGAFSREDDDIRYRIREDEPPRKTGIGYKVFYMKDGKLYPPMVANPNGEATPVGQWLDADAAPVVGQTKTGRNQVKAGGKGTQGGSGTLAYRPGWHLGEIPYALQFGRRNPETGKRELFPKDFVWAEVEYADDVDYQQEAHDAGINANGKYQHSLAGLPYLPKDGSYKYRTNPNPETDPWIITGAMRVNRILKPSEVDEIVKAAGREPQKREAGAVDDAAIDALNNEIEQRKREADGAVKKPNEKERQHMKDRASELAETLHLGDVEVLTTTEGLTGRKAKAKGWYDPETGKITIVMPNHADVGDVVRTLLHEGVAHHGLRKLFGEHFDTFLDNVYNNVTDAIRSAIDARTAKMREEANKKGKAFDETKGRREATEEYMADLAEDTNFENAMKQGWWTKIKDFFFDMLAKAGIKLKEKLTDNDLRYILWRSYENLKAGGRYRSPMETARDVVMQDRLGVGNYRNEQSTNWSTNYHEFGTNFGTREPLTSAGRRRSYYSIETNEQFNKGLSELTEENANSKILNLGSPSSILRSAGIEDKPLKLYGNKLIKKAKKHGFSPSEVKDLPLAVQSPIAIFTGSVEGSHAILTEMRLNGNNVLVSIAVGKGNDIDFNIVSSVYGKSDTGIVDWINNGKLLYADKEKALEYLRISAPIAEAQDIQELDSAANVVRNFENPSIESKEDENILFRDADDTLDRQWRDMYDEATTSAAFKFREAAQDGMLSVTKLMETIAKETGTAIAEDEDVWALQNRLGSTNKTAQEYYIENYYKPIIAAAKDLAKQGARYNAKGKKIIEAKNDISKYIIAKHGLERNDVFAQRVFDKYQQEHPQGRKTIDDFRRDFSGLTELFGGKDDWDAQARQYVADFESDYDTTDLWDAINTATKKTLKDTYEAGLISREGYETARDMFQYYVPLRGWANDVASEHYHYKGGSGEGGRIMKHAKGRTSLAEEPIAYIGRMGQDAILQANKNKVKQRLYNLAMNHDTTLLTVRRQWYQNFGTDTDPDWQRVYPALRSDMDADEVADALKAFDDKMKQLKEQGMARNSRKGLTLGYHTTKGQEQQHRVNVSIGGREYNIFVNGNPRAAQAINGELRMEDDSESIVENTKRWLSKVYTSLKPNFVITNYERDAGFAAAIVAATEPLAYQGAWVKNMAVYNPLTTGVHLTRLINKVMKGKADPNNKEERYMQEFLFNGGETGYVNMLTVDDYKKMVKQEVRKINAPITLKSAARVATGFVETANRVFEDATRFATYVTSREQGRSLDRAIRDAKEISLNFNTRGADGMKDDGGWYKFFRNLRRWWLFVNPSIQGTDKIEAAYRGRREGGGRLKGHPVRSTIMIAGIPALLGYAIGTLTRMVFSGDGDDDDKKVGNAYLDLPKWTRRTNICIPIGGTKFVTIPLSYELRVSYGMGEMLWEIEQGLIEPDEMVKETVTQLSDLLPLSLMGDATAAQQLSPSTITPVVDSYLNKDFTGRPLYKENSFNKDMPEYTKAYAGTAKWLRKSTEWLNNNTGGDKYTPGKIDLNPAIIEHLLNSYLGGLYEFPSQVVKSAEWAMGDEDMADIRNLPILSRNLRDSKSGNPINKGLGDRYWKYMDEYQISKQRFSGYKKETKHGVSEFLPKLMEFYNSPEGKRMLLIDMSKKRTDPIDKMVKEGKEYGGKDSNRNLLRLKNISDHMKEMLVEKLDSVKAAEGR